MRFLFCRFWDVLRNSLGHSQWAFNSIAVRACRCPGTQGIRWSGIVGVQQYRSSCVSMSQSASNSLVCKYGRSTVSQFVRVQVSKRATVSQFGRGDVPKLKRVVGLQIWAFNSIAICVCVERSSGPSWNRCFQLNFHFVSLGAPGPRFRVSGVSPGIDVFLLILTMEVHIRAWAPPGLDSGIPPPLSEWSFSF